MAKLKEGYYWVKHNGKWTIAIVDNDRPDSHFYLTGTDCSFRESEFEEIDHKPIIRPKDGWIVKNH